MQRFTELYTALDQTTRTTLKVAALARYFAEAPPADAAWAIHFLSGQKMQRLIPLKHLRAWSAEVAGIESWMFEECYEIVGDLAETMALILPPPAASSDLPLHAWVTDRLQPLKKMDEAEQRAAMISYWNQLEEQQRFVLHKLITGAFRVGVSRNLVVKGLAQHSDIAAEVLSHRLMGHWEPTAAAFNRLLDPDTTDTQVSQPYPFYLAHPLEKDPESLGDAGDWHAEWKWDGIRAQVLKREGQLFIWSRGEDLMTDRFPELQPVLEQLPDGVVLDGEIVACNEEGILPFTEMQRRINRKTLGKKLLKEVPVVFIAFDVLEWDGEDIRTQAQDWRRAKLAELIDDLADSSPADAFKAIRVSERLSANTWDELAGLRAQCRRHQSEGLMLKRSSGPYRTGRPRGDWWKWKIEPYTVDAVLIYAQRGHGRRASLYTDYTFAVWDDEQLVPFAKAYSGLTDAEIRKVDKFVRKNTLEKFGPVRSVTPELVFELAFENIQPSTRHKSGVAVRFPRITRWRDDLAIADADSLETIRALMAANSPAANQR